MNQQIYDELFGDYHAKLTEIDPNIFRIRPSAISNFFDCPSEWYKEHVLKEGKAFQGSTSSVLGTVLHLCYEYAMLGKELAKDDLDMAIDHYHKLNPNLFDVEEVKLLYPQMLTGVVNEFILPLRNRGIQASVEKEFMLDVDSGYICRGILDLQYGTVIADYKNVSKKPSTDKIPFNYKIQLLCGAQALREAGYLIDTIELIYNVRPTATLPARVFVVREMITPYDIMQLQDTLKLIAESVEITKKQPELTHLIFKSMKLKPTRK